MTTHRCDLKGCGKEESNPLQIKISGYYPNNASGILIPETAREFDFCSHKCFVKWMRWAMEWEDRK
jgi:hypothetical protein